MTTVDEIKTGVPTSVRDTFTADIMRCAQKLRDSPLGNVNTQDPISMEFQVGEKNVIVHMKCSANTQISIIYNR